VANKSLLGLSLLAHGGLAVAIGYIEHQESQAATAIEIAETKKREPEKKPAAEVKPEQPEEPKKLARQKVAAAAPKPAEAPPPLQAQATNEPLPDFGLELSGGTGNGLALPAGGPARGATPALARALGPTVKKPLAAPGAALAGDCDEPAKKPKPLNVPQPAYNERAREAGIEGKVRVELTVDESGSVVSVRVLSGLGYGLDEAAVAAAQRATFEPALRCGKAARATFTISMRFSSS
jgi:periplasmic protein TonB